MHCMPTLIVYMYVCRSLLVLETHQQRKGVGDGKANLLIIIHWKFYNPTSKVVVITSNGGTVCK